MYPLGLKPMILWNFMLHNDVSNNIILKVIMDHLGLIVTRDYPTIILMDSRKVTLIRLLKYLMVFLY